MNGKRWKEEESIGKSKKEAHEVKKFDERISPKRIMARGLSNLRCSQSISNHYVLPLQVKPLVSCEKK